MLDGDETSVFDGVPGKLHERAYQRQTVAFVGERDPRLEAEFRSDLFHFLSRNVRRVGHGGVEFVPAPRFSHVADGKGNSVRYAVEFRVFSRGRYRVFRYIRADAGKDTSVALMTDTKYAFRCYDGDLSVTLTRSAYDPDPYPERGIHDVRIGVTVCAPEKVRDASVAFCHPIAFLSATKHGGSLPLCGSALSVSGATVSAVKPSEDGAGTAIRLYDVTGSAGKARVTLCRRIRRVWLCRNDEKRIRELTPDGCSVEADVPAYGTVTLVIH